MIRFLQTILLIFLLSSLAFSQYFTNWVNYDLINPGNDVTRSAIYNEKTDHVLVATRINDQPDIYILSAATGDTLGRMDMTGVSGGTYPINLLSIADDGKIYACNLSAPAFTPSSTFKIYRWDDENAAPVLLFDDALSKGRYGDAFAAAGEGENLYFYSSGWNRDTLLTLKADVSGTVNVHSKIKLPSNNSARHGVSPVEPGGNLWINGAGDTYPPARLITNDGTVVAEIPDSLVSPGGSSFIMHQTFGQYKLIFVSNGFFSNSIRAVRYYEDELGTVTFDYFGDDSDSLMLAYNGNTTINNVNATATLSYDNRRHSLITVMGVNSVASVSLDSLLKASTPRDSLLEISVDGIMDFFPTDHVGTSNDREMYLTWSEGKFFTAFTGQTLIDPTLTNFLYIAFDLDPDGSAGSNTPPGESGAVSELPFKADVVFMIEPYTEEDVNGMLGKTFKWNGSAWTESVFRGNDASQGALSYSKAGDFPLTEFAAIMNDAGIGNDFTNLSVMAYLAEKGSGGEVLSAFPDNNPLGNGVKLGAYFYMDKLGRGWFPADTNYVHIRGEGVTAIEDNAHSVINDYELYQNYPNPFNPETVIRYDVQTLHATSVHIDLTIYNLLGQKVRTLVSEKKRAGKHKVTFNAGDLSSGVYFYQLRIDGNPVSTRKMILMK